MVIGAIFAYLRCYPKYQKMEDRRVKSIPAYLRHVKQLQLYPHPCPQVQILHPNQ